MNGITDAVAWLSEVGVLGVLVLIVLAWLRGWVHSHREFEALRAEKEWWRDTAMRALSIGEVAVSSRRPDDSGAGRSGAPPRDP